MTIQVPSKSVVNPSWDIEDIFKKKREKLKKLTVLNNTVVISFGIFLRQEYEIGLRCSSVCYVKCVFWRMPWWSLFWIPVLLPNPNYLSKVSTEATALVELLTCKQNVKKCFKYFHAKFTAI